MTDVTRVPFHGTTILTNNDGSQIVVRPVCEALGLDADAQQRRIKRQPWASTAMMTVQVPGDDQRRDMLTVDRRTFTMWLATVETGRLKNEQAREMLVAFQTEAADALDRYFNEGGAINPRANEHQVNALIRQAQMQMELCQAAKGLIHPDHLEARARVVLARGLGEFPELDEERRPLYTQDFLKSKGLAGKALKRIAPTFGKRVKAAYVLRHGEAPQQYDMNLSNGQTRPVNGYTEADRDLMQDVWDAYYAAEVAAA